MSLLPGSPGRRHPTHHEPVDKINRSTIVFLTVCTKDRKPLLANSAAQKVLTKWWRQSTRWLAGKYGILPDHVHLFCAPSSDEPLQRWVAYWKNLTARELNTELEPFWQRDFWDVQMRTSESYGTQWEYIRQNPVRHGLAESAEAWPYQGEINVLDWVDV
jgi:REP-associated tyrosine transposase